MGQIYFCNAEKFQGLYEKLLPFIPKERQKKVNRLLKNEDRLLSALSGAMLKKVLCIDENETFLYNEHGKPYIEHGKHFSVSHSGDIAVLAVSDNDIGVDVELPKEANEKVMRRCFTEEEMAFASSSPKDFALVWTMKESAVKLLGKGLSFPLKNFSVLPFNEKHMVDGTEMYFFSTIILGVPLTAASYGNEEFTIKEFKPEELID